MSLNDRISQASFSPQKKVYGDPIFFQDEEGDYSIESTGIFKSQFTLVDSVGQQEVVSDVPTIWVSRPTAVDLDQGMRIKWKGQYFIIKEIHNDVDHNAYNLLLHSIEAPNGS